MDGPQPESPAAAAAAIGAPALLRSGAQKRKAGRLAAAAKVVARRREKWRAAFRARYRKDPNHKRAAAKAAYAVAPDKKRALARAASKAAYAAAPDEKRALLRRERRVLFAELSSQGGRSTPTPHLFPTVVDANCIAHACSSNKLLSVTCGCGVLLLRNAPWRGTQQKKSSSCGWRAIQRSKPTKSTLARRSRLPCSVAAAAADEV